MSNTELENVEIYKNRKTGSLYLKVEEIDKEKARFLNLTDKRIYTIAYDDLELWVTGEALWVTKETSAYLKRNDTNPRRYYEPELDLDGTADEIFIQARNGYIKSSEVLGRIQEILTAENKMEKAQYVGILKEIAEEDGTESYSLGTMKKDCLDGMYELIGNAPINDDGTLLLSVYNDRNTIIVSLIEENNDSISHGVGSLSKEEFLHMTPKEFDGFVGQVYGLNMVKTEKERSVKCKEEIER